MAKRTKVAKITLAPETITLRRILRSCEIAHDMERRRNRMLGATPTKAALAAQASADAIWRPAEPSALRDGTS